MFGAGLVLAASHAAQAEHPLLTTYPGSTVTRNETVDYAEYQRIVGARDGASLTETVSGKLTRLAYRNPDGRSAQEIATNYREALVAAGLAVDYTCEGREACASTGRGRDNPGWNAINGMNVGIAADVRYFSGRMTYGENTAYVSVAVSPSVHHVHIVEVQAMERGLVVADAAALGRALDRDGRAVVDGIYFETDSAVLQAASDPALTEVARLLTTRPELRLYVVGHTDARGSFAHNQRLSAARAESVATALVERSGIARARLSAHGVGPLAPATGNASDDGRARNRRVEIVLQ
jgi:outer membrane protein OmpA-like peptidoglycan-associated protein